MYAKLLIPTLTLDYVYAPHYIIQDFSQNPTLEKFDLLVFGN